MVKQAKIIGKSSNTSGESLVLSVGTIVLLKIKDEDRGQLDPPRIAGVIVNVTRHGTYRIGFGNGVLKDSLCLRDLIVLTDHTAASKCYLDVS